MASQIRDPRDSQVFTIAHIVIGLLLHIHSFIHLGSNPVNRLVATSQSTARLNPCLITLLDVTYPAAFGLPGTRLTIGG